MWHSRVRTVFWICCLFLLLSSLPVQAQDNPWVEVGLGSASGGGISGLGDVIEPSIATALDGTIYVAWTNLHSWLDATNTVQSTSDIYIKSSTGDDWQEVGTESATGRGISDNLDYEHHNGRPIVKVAPDGTPYVLWIKAGMSSNGFNLCIKRFNGTNWEEVAAGSASGACLGEGIMPDMAIAPDGTVYVAWSSYGYNYNGATAGIFVLRFNGTAWEEAGTGSASCCGGGISQGQGPGKESSIKITPNGIPYVVWTCQFGGASSQICVRRFNGTSWEEVGVGSATFPYGMSAMLSTSEAPSLAIGPADLPYVAWITHDAMGIGNVYVRRFNGTDWEAVGVGSDSGWGISNTSQTNSYFPHLIFMDDGLPYVFWKEDLRGQPGYYSSDLAIWVRRFNGDIWEEIFPGSASLKGIDGTTDDTDAPSVENNVGTTAFMTYNARSGSSNAIYVRRYEYSAPNAAPVRNYVTDQPTKLTWNPVTSAYGYHIQVDTDKSFLSPFIVDTTVRQPELLLNTLAPHRYYWRVQAIYENAGKGGWSATEAFTVGMP